MTDILFASLIIGVAGIILGIILAVFSKLMTVEVEEKEEKIRAMLPSANCGACGYTGCDGYAQALASGDEKNITLCKPGGQHTVDQISAYLGIKADKIIKTTAVVMCQGNSHHTQKRANYTGPKSCQMATLVAGGDALCGYGCLGYGDCVSACKFDALHIIDGVAFVDPTKCTSCMECIKICPRNIIQLMPLERAYSIVFCQNEDRGPVANKVCQVSCIACRRCLNACPENCITINNNRAVIDYEKCTNCGACQQVCPHQCILSLYPVEELLSKI
ncbi:MAG: RnfABCDGE type electron transport complex subunit B [Clostridiaceae bacterium]|nr:RnfABCDGE type electron transport complex subunit B [Clostridiaceae bacterium]